MWDADVYLKYTDERSRPFADLLAQVPREPAARIVDLGCGPGNHTRTLAERWPAAHVIGVDNSAELLEKAKPLVIPGRLEFVQESIENWSAAQPVDLLLSNAALHWIGDHPHLIPRLAGMIAPGGTLAVQVPNRFDSPSQHAIEATTADPRWADRLKGHGLHRESVMPLTWYCQQLIELGFRVNAWETTYVHVLSGADPVVEWFKGSALRPFLERLTPEQTPEFLADLAGRFRTLYPPTRGFTLFPFPRLFFVATRPR